MLEEMIRKFFRQLFWRSPPSEWKSANLAGKRLHAYRCHYLRIEMGDIVDYLASRVGVEREALVGWASGVGEPTLTQAHTIEEITDGVVPIQSWKRKP